MTSFANCLGCFPLLCILSLHPTLLFLQPCNSHGTYNSWCHVHQTLGTVPRPCPLYFLVSSMSQGISKWKKSFFMFVMLPEKSSAFLKMFKNLHFTNWSITVNAPSQTVCCRQLSSMTHCTHVTVKTCRQWLLLCNYAKKWSNSENSLLRGERGLRYITLCVPSPMLVEFLGIMFKQTQLSWGCLARGRLMGTGNTEAAQQRCLKWAPSLHNQWFWWVRESIATACIGLCCRRINIKSYCACVAA